MRIDCIHGFFIFREDAAGEASKFMSLFGLSLVKEKDFYTFETIAEAPRYVLEGGTYLGAPALVTYEGEPWDIMRENSLIYNFNLDTVVPIASITQRISIAPAGNIFISSGLILPGSVKDDGSRVKDYAARYLFDQSRFKYSEVAYV